MNATLFRPALLVSVLALSVAGCRCGTQPGVNQNNGELLVIWRDADGNRILNRDATFDFGQAIVGQRVTQTMTVRNGGAGKLTLTKIERTEGDEFVSGAATAGVPFNIEFIESTLNTSEQVEFSMSFSPTALKGSFETKLLLTAEGARAEDSTAIITLRGGGEKGACDLPAVIDFGKTPVGETLNFTQVLNNPTSIDANGFAGDFTGADATSFGYPAGGLRGSIAVNKMSSANVVITFSPTEKRAYEAQVKLRGAGECPEQTVTVKGIGSDDVLTWTPSMLAFGSVAPGFESVREVVFTNQSNVPIVLTNITTTQNADYSQKVLPGDDASKFTVPGGAVPTPMKVVCSPAGLGPRPANLTFSTGMMRMPQGVITMTCQGGGPKIKVTPRPTLGFGRVGFFPGNPTFNVARKVTIQNVGTRGNPPQVTDNLFLGQLAMDGTPGQLPLFELVPHAGTDADEFTVSLGSPYDPLTGLQAVAGANFVDLSVILSPKSAGPKGADLKIYSNDDSENEVVVTLTADAAVLPPCNYRVSPAMANFGLVTPGTSKDLPITITNLGTATQDVCYLSGIDLAAGTNPVFTIVGGPIVEKELQPQQSVQVVVRITPVGPVPTMLETLTGTLQFNVTSPTTPQATVPLRASVGPSCLVVTPDPLDFATTKIGCNTPEKQMQIYNVCSSPVTITSMSLQAAGGQPPGGPDCTGTNPCPEFYLTQLPTIPGNGLTINAGSAPVILKAKYKPIDIGSDSGAIAINALQNGQSVTYLVGLQGNGDTIGQQTDTFMQDLAPRADILLVVDDSCSMSDKQTSLANNFGSFIQYAQAASVDYQLGVTTTSAEAEECPPFGPCIPSSSVANSGKLHRNSTAGPILKNTTPNVASKFSTLVNVGTNGDGIERGLESAVLALTPPMIVGDNAGFLRPDANLAVVVVTDAEDQSDQPVSYYQNRLINIKGFNRLSMFTFSNIGPYLATPPGNCSYDGNDYAQRYEALVQATGGVKDEICTTNWSAALQGLGRTAFGFRTQFFMNATPDLTGGKVIEVKVNGTVVPTTSWRYESATNSVVFNPTAVPSPGQSLTIQYFVACF